MTGRLSFAFGMSKPSSHGLEHGIAIPCRVQTSNECAGKSDVWSIHALGTNITKGNMKPVPYATTTNCSDPPEMLRGIVACVFACNWEGIFP